MVTIKYNNVNLGYYSDDWIEEGIAEDAIIFSARQWQKEDYFGRNYYVDEIRNYCWPSKRIEALNKW